MDIERSKEYPIDTWIRENSGRRIYLASAYVWDGSVTFLYVYDAALSNSAEENTVDFFEYEVNGLQAMEGNGWLIDKLDNDKDSDLYYLVKNRLPEELRSAGLAFFKWDASFAKPIDEIKNITIYPQTQETKRYLVDKAFTVPYGKCDIKIPYTINGQRSYIILRELKIVDMLEEFEKNYEEIKKARENTLKEWDEKGKPWNQVLLELDELRRYYDKRRLLLTYLKPEQSRSIEFYTAGHLNTGTIYISIDKNEMMDGLYKDIAVICEITGEPELEYEITLMFALEHIEYERKAVLRRDFEK